MDGTAVTHIFNERLRTENSCSVTSINENLHESQANGNLNKSHPSAVLFSHVLFVLECICLSKFFEDVYKWIYFGSDDFQSFICMAR